MERFDFHDFAEKEDKIIGFDIIIEGYSSRRFFYIFVFANNVENFEYYFAHYVF